MTNDWDFYFANVNGALSSIFVDLGIRATVPDTHRPHILWIWVPMLRARDDGLSSDDESSTLHLIEDELAQILGARNDAHLVGRITGANRREYYLYGRDADQLADSIDSVFAKFPNYVPEFGEQRDVEWTHYLTVLYPGTRELQRIKNRRTIDALANAGDSLVTKRPITHWVYCRHEAELQRLRNNFTALGFVVSNTNSDFDSSYPFALTAIRDDVADQDAIDHTVFQILDVLNDSDAIYDGWESPVR